MDKACIIVDNHKVVREALCEWLELEFPDITFYRAKTGEEAIRFSNDYQPALFILEIDLPNMSGFDVIEQIKKQNPEANFILHSLQTDEKYRETAQALEVFNFIPKGTPRMELISSVEHIFAEEPSTG